MKYFVYRLYTFLREHEEGCNFFDDFGLLIQFILGVISLSFLVLKRYLEFPRRDWLTWFLDTSKQIAGQLTQHGFNLLISSHLGSNGGSECEWYIVNLINDSTIGLLFQIIYLRIITWMLRGTKYEFQTGDYGEKFEIGNYIYQMNLWIFIVILVRLICLTIG
jgi:hypothetical protein